MSGCNHERGCFALLLLLTFWEFFLCLYPSPTCLRQWLPVNSFCVAANIIGAYVAGFLFCFEIYSFNPVTHKGRDMEKSIHWFTRQMAAIIPAVPRNSIGVSHVHAGFQALELCSTAFPGVLAGSWTGSGTASTPTNTYMECCCPRYACFYVVCTSGKCLLP